MMETEMAVIGGWNDRYGVDRLGNVYEFLPNDEAVLMPVTYSYNNKRLMVEMERSNGHRANVAVARIVMITFCPHLLVVMTKQVSHIDGNHRNCALANLIFTEYRFMTKDYKGVKYNRRNKLFEAVRNCGGKRIVVGSDPDPLVVAKIWDAEMLRLYKNPITNKLLKMY